MTMEIHEKGKAIQSQIQKQQERIAAFENWQAAVAANSYAIPIRDGHQVRLQSFIVCLEGEILAAKQEVFELQCQFDAL